MHMNNTTAVGLYFYDISQTAESKLLFLKQPIWLGWALTVMEAFAGNAIVFGLPCQLVITRSQKTNGSLIFCTLIWGWLDTSSPLVLSLLFALFSRRPFDLKGVKTVLAAFGWHHCQYSIICLFLWHLWSLKYRPLHWEVCESDFSRCIWCLEFDLLHSFWQVDCTGDQL